MSKNVLEVLEAEFVESLEPLSPEAQRTIYGTGWGGRKSVVIDIDPVELETRPVGSMPEITFCGQKFYTEVILGVPLNHTKAPQLTKQFAAFVEELNRLGELALHEPGAMNTRMFVSSDKTALFMGAVARMTEFTSWKVEFVPSEIYPSAGLDARVIVPQ